MISKLCPRHWQLPSGGDYWNTPVKARTYRNLLEKYGWQATGTRGSEDDGVGPLTWESDTKSYNVAKQPFYLIRGGVVSNRADLIVSIGYNGTWMGGFIGPRWVSGYDVNNTVTMSPVAQSGTYGRQIRCLISTNLNSSSTEES